MKELIGLIITPDLARGIGLALDAMSDTCDFVEELWDEGRMVGNHEEAVTEKVCTFLTRMDSEQGRAYQAITEEFQKLDADRDSRQEQATLAGMAHGAEAYNEAMGWDTSSPEPCGHHCIHKFPRCHCMYDDDE